jgi:hypothetical protein
MAGEGERRQAGNIGFDADLLVQFADEAFFRRLAGLDLAARKLPQAGQLLAFGALRQKHAAVGIDQRAGCDQEQALADRVRAGHAPGGRR